MVAISLYRGNMHRVPDVPRRWVMPRPSISLKEFRRLLRRRSKALSVLREGQALASTSAPAPSAIENGNHGNPPLLLPPLPPLPPPPPLQRRADEHIEEERVKPRDQNVISPGLVEVKNSVRNVGLEDCKAEVGAEELAKLVSLDEGKVKVVEEKVVSAVRGEGSGGDIEGLLVEKVKEEEPEKKNEDPNSEGNKKLGATNEKEERKREVEEKLEILNKKKHNLVQALKQILGAEEELKRRSSMQLTRPSLPLQVDVSNDSGSMTRVATPRTGSEAIVGGNAGGGEADDVLNHDLQSRHIPRMSSISPSAESVLKRPYFQHNAASIPSRSSALVSGSPLRFAFSGSQVQASNLPPPVSTSGTNYAVSLSSPAASVGTSSFKDARSASS